MLKVTFMFVAFLHGQTYVLDTHMSGEDCTSAIIQGVSRIEVNPHTTIDASGATLACEIDDER